MAEWRLWHGLVAGVVIGSLVSTVTPTSPAAPFTAAPPQTSDARDGIQNRHTAAMPTGRGYINSDGNWTRSPVYSDHGPPPGSTAHCADGTYSFSAHRRGTCSYHGGVAQWN